MMKQKYFFILSMLLCSLGGFSQNIVRNEEVVYTILAFNGKEFVGTFNNQNHDTVYMISGQDNFLSPVKTFSFYWPLSGEWKIDPDALSIELDGVLEIFTRGSDRKVIEKSLYTYYNVRGDYGMNWKASTDQEAVEIFNLHQGIMNLWLQKRAEYRQALGEYESRKEYLFEKLRSTKTGSREYEDYYRQYKELQEPVVPEQPSSFHEPPIPPRFAFRINLPPGEYMIRLRDGNGRIFQGSEKKLIAYGKLDSSSIGYEIIPADKWTQPGHSRYESSVIYLDGSTDLYVRPYHQNLYNDFLFRKTIRNDATGNGNIEAWVQLQQIADANIVIAGYPEGRRIIGEAPYIVEQSLEKALGYRILPFTSQYSATGRSPSLFACHIPIESSANRLVFSLDGGDGSTIVDGAREIRVIRKRSLPIPLVFVPLLFLIAGILMPLLRLPLLKMVKNRNSSIKEPIE